MRELARLLMEIKKLDLSVVTLFDALKPHKYDILVKATKLTSGYDDESQTYKSPTYAMNMGTTLKQCCDVALLHVLKKSKSLPTVDNANVEADIKTCIQLIEANWRFDISTNAANDLNLKKWNKVTLVPLATDLKLLKDYLMKVAANQVSMLQKNPSNEKAYTSLLETVYCRLLLLNRRRPGELQRLPIHVYKSAISEEHNQAYEEFSEAITETERILMRSFKRIVIRGKRGRGVPVLISKDVQDHLNLILECRDNIQTVTVKVKPEDVPLNLRAHDVTTHSMTLSWSPPIRLNPVKYKIAYDAIKEFVDSQGITQTQIIPKLEIALSSDVRSYTINELSPFTTYSVNVSAVPADNSYLPPTKVTVTTQMAAPQPMPLLPSGSARRQKDNPKEPRSILTDELITNVDKVKDNSNLPYIAAKFPQRNIPYTYHLGTGEVNDGFINHKLQHGKRYRIFVRAVVDTPQKHLYTSSPFSEFLSLDMREVPPGEPPSRPDPNTPSVDVSKVSSRRKTQASLDNMVPIIAAPSVIDNFSDIVHTA
ncbi:unnamed protein product [Acanthoscelides obtectus]|uniref:Fibronectin type-III domain-containing protein n=1 Tax=Acanthoscelides obtectus TaxID=200917 RepID=A0A9P0PZP8_ACAOB|nr:unnamed protein product [Acanthoscelides obtectus]CAK1634129.1 Tyrosine-protein phosphatase Lar [Acanthoscelides obtectus]